MTKLDLLRAVRHMALSEHAGNIGEASRELAALMAVDAEVRLAAAAFTLAALMEPGLSRLNEDWQQETGRSLAAALDAYTEHGQ